MTIARPGRSLRPSRAGAFPLVVLLMAGCAINPAPSPDEIREQTGTLPELELEEPWRTGDLEASAVQDDWLSTFGDPQLDALAAEAVRNNADLRVAAVRVELAGAYVRMAEAALRPKLGVFGTGGINLGGGDISSALQGIMFGFSWEPDLWGRLRYARNAARETEASVLADYEFARQSIAATVARTWFDATLAGMQQRRTESMMVAAAELVDLAEQRNRVGVGDELEIATARTRLGNLEDSLLQLRLAQSQSVRALEVLLGRYPAAELEASAELPPLPDAIPVGLPLQLLERRPDLVAAERRVAAAFNRVGEAKAARLPSITLNASIGAVESDIVELKEDFENPTAGAGARLVAPVYEGGALKGQVTIRTLEQKEAVADYARAALVALGDVEQGLAAAASLAERAVVLERIIAENERALDLASSDYRIGSGDLRAVRQQELALESARLALLAVRAGQLVERINLHLALGGSFDMPPPEEEQVDPGELAATSGGR